MTGFQAPVPPRKAAGVCTVIGGVACRFAPFSTRPEIKQEDPLDLSILLSGGKETNKDCPSNGE